MISSSERSGTKLVITGVVLAPVFHPVALAAVSFGVLGSAGSVAGARLRFLGGLVLWLEDAASADRLRFLGTLSDLALALALTFFAPLVLAGALVAPSGAALALVTVSCL